MKVRMGFRPWMFFNRTFNNFRIYRICGGALTYEKYCVLLHFKPISDWEDYRFAKESKIVD
jgi:hypothetical protein